MVHPDMKALQKGIIAAKRETDLKEIVQAAVGPSGFMEFVRFELGEVLCKEQGTRARQQNRNQEAEVVVGLQAHEPRRISHCVFDFFSGN